MPATILGWDIGGVNTKVARATGDGGVEARTHPFEIQRDPDALPALLRRAARELAGDATVHAHAVTMTAELSQRFRRKREGVAFVLDAVERAFPGAAVHVFATDGRWLAPADARRDALAVAASNWAATARVVARRHPDALLIDIGTTTTDIIPIVRGVVAARGRTDPERLRHGELLYSGALRTPVEAIVHSVPLLDGRAGVSAEGFALVGDAHLWLGALAPEDYTAPTPDGRPASRELAGERLARVVCADREMLDDATLDAIAAHVAEEQAKRVCASVNRVLDGAPSLDTAVVTGLGAWIGEDAARRAGMRTLRLADTLGESAARAAPSAAVALLLAEWLAGGEPRA